MSHAAADVVQGFGLELHAKLSATERVSEDFRGIPSRFGAVQEALGSDLFRPIFLNDFMPTGEDKPGMRDRDGGQQGHERKVQRMESVQKHQRAGQAAAAAEVK